MVKLCFVMIPEAADLNSPEQTILKDLVIVRHQKLMIWECVSQEKADVLAKAIDALEKRIDKIAAAIQTLIKPLRNSLVLKSILRSIPDIEDTIFATHVADVPELSSIDPRKAVTLIRLMSFNNDSGKTSGQRSMQGDRYAS